MATVIEVNSDTLSAKLLKAARASIKKADNVMRDVMEHGYINNERYVHSKDEGYFFNWELCDDACSCSIEIQNLRKELDILAKILNTGPDALVDVDRSYKKTWVDKWKSSKLYGILFGKNSSGKVGTGAETVIDAETNAKIDDMIKVYAAAGVPIAMLEAARYNQTRYSSDPCGDLKKSLKEGYPEATKYIEYREKVDKINTTVPYGEPQDGERFGNGIECVAASKATLVKRKQALDGNEVNYSRDKYLRDHPGSVVYAAPATDSQGITYSFITEEAPNLSEKRLIELLQEHPEGIEIYGPYDPRIHAIVISDYQIEDGEIQFYAFDPVNDRDYHSGRIKYTDTYFFKNGGRYEKLERTIFIE